MCEQQEYLVACVNASGESDMFLCDIGKDLQKLEEDALFEYAESQAKNDDYGGPFVVFDPHDQKNIRRILEEIDNRKEVPYRLPMTISFCVGSVSMNATLHVFQEHYDDDKILLGLNNGTLQFPKAMRFCTEVFVVEKDTQIPVAELMELAFLENAVDFL